MSDRLGKVGGQAVLEGVMMKAGNRMVTTCRKADGGLVVTDELFTSARQKHKVLDLPLIRGVVSFAESMIMSFKTMGASADALGLEEEEPSKFEKWLAEKCGAKITDVVMIVALILGLGLSALLFVFLPIWLTAGINLLLGWAFSISMPAVVSATLEGFVKMAIFVGYLAAVSLMPDIKRTFMYHGAEHKTIFCYEQGLELTVENVRRQSRFHPRCGTSFLILMLLVSIVVNMFIPATIVDHKILNIVARTGIGLITLPFIMGIGYELIRFAGRHDNLFTRIISAPGVWLQHITTKEPDDSMIECAIAAVKEVIPEDGSDNW
jgi:uncharacterized protein YqhQ